MDNPFLKLVVAFAFCAMGTSGLGQSNVSSVLDSSGTLSAGGGMTNVSAAGQPGGISVSENGAIVNYAGFLNTFSMRPALDTDGDGLADEVDSDNDNDSLKDATELAGSAFSPATTTGVNDPDSDNDGSLDGFEAGAGTDPTDPDALLHIVNMRKSGSNVEVDYLGRGGPVVGKTYVIYAKDQAGNILSSRIFTNNTPAGGAAPWYVVTNTFAEAFSAGPSNRFFAVEALP